MEKRGEGAYSKSSQAIEKMRQDEGGTLSQYLTKMWTFYPVFKTYFKLVNDCGVYPDNCLNQADIESTYKTIRKESIAPNNYLYNEGQFITPDGMFWMIENGVGPIYITVDVNGYKKGPNVFGRDVFSFQIINDRLLPMGANGTSFTTSAGYCDKNRPGRDQGIGCMYNVMQGIDY